MSSKILITTSILSSTTASSNQIVVTVVEFYSPQEAMCAVTLINEARQHNSQTRQTAILI